MAITEDDFNTALGLKHNASLTQKQAIEKIVREMADYQKRIDDMAKQMAAHLQAPPPSE